MFERFTVAARGAMRRAEDEARALSHSYIGTEHVLLGLLSGTDDAVARVLDASGVDHTYARVEAVRLVGLGCSWTELGQQEAEALRTIGIDLDQVRSSLEGTFGPGVLDQSSGGAAGGRLPLTRRTKKSLQLAAREARRLERPQIGPEHVLLGLLREGQGIAAQVIETRVSLANVRRRLLAEVDTAA